MEIGSGTGTGSGSGSVTESGGSSTESSFTGGLKFGQKLYFEDSGGRGLGSGPLGSSPSPSSTGWVRRGRGGGSGHQSGQPPRCQVEGCSVDLSNTKAYYSRHKVCGMHSKSSKVVVAGLEQRFCQQCSRFHQLPEFDQEKRSCRRRLAGHNERRRKPQPASLLTSRYGRLSQSLFGNAGTTMDGSFLGDPMAWSAVRSSDAAAMRRSFSAPPWQINPENHPLNIFPQGGLVSAGGETSFSSPEIMTPRVESYKGVTDSNCALSLLSNQQHHHHPHHAPERAYSGFNLMTIEGVSSVQPAPVLAPGLAPCHYQYSNPPWEFKNSENISSGSHNMPPALCLGQISHTANSEMSGGGVMGGFELSHHQQTRRQFMEPENNTRAYDSSASQHVHWSL